MDSLFTPMGSSRSMEEPTENEVQHYINRLEGWKTKIKNLHWSAPKMNTHKLLDDITSDVNAYQDGLAESEMGINGKFQPNMLKGIPSNVLNIRDLINEMIVCTSKFYDNISQDTIYVGIKSETETFIHTLTKYKYLATLVDSIVY